MMIISSRWTMMMMMMLMDDPGQAYDCTSLLYDHLMSDDRTRYCQVLAFRGGEAEKLTRVDLRRLSSLQRPPLALSLIQGSQQQQVSDTSSPWTHQLDLPLLFASRHSCATTTRRGNVER